MPIDWPSDFFVLPDGSAVHKADARPCPRCGATDFVVARGVHGACTVQCPNCVKLGDAAVLGTLDRRAWTMTPNARAKPRGPRP